MNNKQRTNKAFTLIELVVSIAILAIVVSFAGVIFKVCIDSYRVAAANAEIMQKLRAITDQLNADFKGLRKDGEIFVVWSALPLEDLIDIREPIHKDAYADDADGHIRFDRIMFFADGDFSSYRAAPVIRGNVARISYMLANRRGAGPMVKPYDQYRHKRVLARTQHILTADSSLQNFINLDPNSVLDEDLDIWHNRYEYDKISLEGWKNIPRDDKMIALSVVTDVNADYSGKGGGALVDPADANSVHMLLCEGVGEFMIQGCDLTARWRPDVDWNNDRNLTDGTDFILAGAKLDPAKVLGVLYPRGGISFGDGSGGYLLGYDPNLLDRERFNQIPGLGRALKFTFTLYDSRGIIRNGRTFTHIVYLDN